MGSKGGIDNMADIPKMNARIVEIELKIMENKETNKKLREELEAVLEAIQANTPDPGTKPLDAFEKKPEAPSIMPSDEDVAKAKKGKAKA